MDNLIRKEAISEELGVSLATVNNWIKTRVIPVPNVDGYYTKDFFELIVSKVTSNTERLSSRANRSLQSKKEVCYLGIKDKKRKELLNALVANFEHSNLTIDIGILSLIYAILRSNNLIKKNWQPNANSKIDVMLSNWIQNINQNVIENVYAEYDIPNINDDILGAFYQSIQCIAQKSNKGAYYTPHELLIGIKVPPNKTVLDPCCGSGSILLNVLSKKHDASKVFARDIDEIALKICFINLVLFFNDKNMSANIAKQDVLLEGSDLFLNNETKQFDFIITNPPWGKKHTKQQKAHLLARYSELKTTESFSLSLYNALNKLNKNGEIYFFLPHSFLNVAAHRNIRKFVFNHNNNIGIKLLGNAFKGVLSESILIHIVRKGTNQRNVCIQNKEGNTYELPQKNIIPPDYIVSATGNTQDSDILEKIYQTEYITLQTSTIFGLGIVTGNNKKHLLHEKTNNAEALFRGKDIGKYAFMQPEYFIVFQPELYQQVAPEKYYRHKKIAYRFINDSLVCVLDNNNSLLLNSANFIISEKYPMETITAFFNSDIYTFIFRKKFHSKKVLKSHLQDLPLPILPQDTHKYIFDLHNKIICEKNKKLLEFQAEIDEIICKAFSINKNQYAYIKGVV